MAPAAFPSGKAAGTGCLVRSSRLVVYLTLAAAVPLGVHL